MIPLVQPRCGLLLALLWSTVAPLQAEEKPPAQEILRTVRLAQAAENRTLTGQLRTGGKKVPFTLTMKGGAVRWDFQDPPQAFILKLGEKSSTLEEVTGDGKGGKVAAARFDEGVRGSDITFEDLSLRFLYWPEATVEGDQTIMLTSCWQVLVTPPNASASTYSKVRVWVAKENGALLKCEAFGRDGKLARTFRVVSGQKTGEGLWILKQMRIESASPRPGGDRTPSYLEIDPVK